MIPTNYFRFLVETVGGEEHSLLLRQLHDTPYYSTVPNDDNRGEDGKKLREIFQEECYSSGVHMDPSSLPNGDCSMLEMLIGLSFRMENELEGNPNAKDAEECFWTLIKNLDLDWCDDCSYYENDSEPVVRRRLSNLLDRKYSKYGKGGLFPIVRSRNDQRNVEIWYQMCEYLLDNYDF